MCVLHPSLNNSTSVLLIPSHWPHVRYLSTVKVKFITDHIQGRPWKETANQYNCFILMRCMWIPPIIKLGLNLANYIKELFKFIHTGSCLGKLASANKMSNGQRPYHITYSNDWHIKTTLTYQFCEMSCNKKFNQQNF